VADVSRAILKVAESPKAMELERAWFKKKEQSCPDPITNPDPNPSFTSRQLDIDSFLFLFVGVLLVCVMALGNFTYCFLAKDQVSYLDKVEMSPCSSSQQMPVKRKTQLNMSQVHDQDSL